MVAFGVKSEYEIRQVEMHTTHILHHQYIIFDFINTITITSHSVTKLRYYFVAEYKNK